MYLYVVNYTTHMNVSSVVLALYIFNVYIYTFINVQRSASQKLKHLYGVIAHKACNRSSSECHGLFCLHLQNYIKPSPSVLVTRNNTLIIMYVSFTFAVFIQYKK